MMTVVSCYCREFAYGLETGSGKVLVLKAFAVILSTPGELQL